MSFLEALKSRKTLLKPVQTTVTQADGSRRRESATTHAQLSPRMGFVVDTTPDAQPAQILPDLYLGSQDCCALTTLEQFGINTVLSIGIQAPNKYEHIEYVFLECLDLPHTDISDCLKRANACINSAVRAKRRVLVHCNAGVSRSATIVLGFLILELGMSYKDAYLLVKTARPCVKPNSGFAEQLVRLKH